MPNCKDCRGDLEIRASNSAKNPGKQYWSCPNRCKCWNGWIEDDMVKESQEPSGIFCKECKTECLAKESRTEKNKGKKFWSCPKRCKVWNGWIESVNGGGQSNTSNTSNRSNMSNMDNTVKTAPIKRKEPGAGPSKVEPTGQPLPKKFMFSHYCVGCDKELDFDHEIQTHLKRYRNGISTKFMNPTVELSVATELRESLTSGDYTCEECLGNE